MPPSPPTIWASSPTPTDSASSTNRAVCPRPLTSGWEPLSFRREALARLTFHWEPGRCECQCCCDDLRRMGLGIAYLPRTGDPRAASGSRSHHVILGRRPCCNEMGSRARLSRDLEPHILTTFDRRHLNRFSSSSCRRSAKRAMTRWSRRWRTGSGPANGESSRRPPGSRRVPRGRRRLSVDPPAPRLPGRDRTMARRVHPSRTGTRATSSSRAPLHRFGTWSAIIPTGSSPSANLASPGKLGRLGMDLSIHDPSARKFAFDLLSTRPFLNGGFAAGTARAMLDYLVRPTGCSTPRPCRVLRLGRSDGPQSLLPLATRELERDLRGLELHDLCSRSGRVSIAARRPVRDPPW